MTVAELIAALGEYPPDMPVVVAEGWYQNECHYGWADPGLEISAMSNVADKPGVYHNSWLSPDKPLPPKFFVALCLVQRREE